MSRPGAGGTGARTHIAGRLATGDAPAGACRVPPGPDVAALPFSPKDAGIVLAIFLGDFKPSGTVAGNGQCPAVKETGIGCDGLGTRKAGKNSDE